MRFFLLVYLSVFLYNNAASQNVTIPDAAFLAALIQSGVDTNADGAIQVSEAKSISALNVSHAGISSMEGVQAFINLTTIICEGNFITFLDLSGINALEHIDVSNNQLNELILSPLSSLASFDCSNNMLTSVDLSSSTDINFININNNFFSAIDINHMVNLTSLFCRNNLIPELDLSSSQMIAELDCAFNLLTALDCSGLSSLAFLEIEGNPLGAIDLSNCSSLTEIMINSNSLETLDVIGCTSLGGLFLFDARITELDLSTLPDLQNLELISCEELRIIYFKNGTPDDVWGFDFENMPNWRVFCVDEEDIDDWEAFFQTTSFTNILLGSYCPSSSSSGFNYELSGHVQYDVLDNGCSDGAISVSNQRLEISNDQDSYIFTTDSTGSFELLTFEGDHRIVPLINNAIISTPSELNVSFPGSNSQVFEKFCLSSDELFQDVSINVYPLDLSRPGFENTYVLSYRNLGTIPVSGDIRLSFPVTVEYLESTVLPSAVFDNFLNWEYADLKPYEEKQILITFRLNSPMDEPPLNDGDAVSFIANVTPLQEDVDPANNQFLLRDPVVNSFDPNDKTCLQGDQITPDMVGELLSYKIRFENLGSAEAVNIVVLDTIDTSVFDISSAEPVDASHSYRFRVIDENVLEFVFENIYLGFEDDVNDGFVIFKIRTVPGLQLGDVIENKAGIYFDFNFPIITNIASTEVSETVSVSDVNKDLRINLFPNPGSGIIHLSCPLTIERIVVRKKDGSVVLFNNSVNSSKTVIDIGDLSPQILFLDLFYDGYKSTHKLVVSPN